MKDLIERQAAIDALQGCAKGFSEGRGW